jgi:hypothetical protein
MNSTIIDPSQSRPSAYRAASVFTCIIGLLLLDRHILPRGDASWLEVLRTITAWCAGAVALALILKARASRKFADHTAQQIQSLINDPNATHWRVDPAQWQPFARANCMLQQEARNITLAAIVLIGMLAGLLAGALLCAAHSSVYGAAVRDIAIGVSAGAAIAAVYCFISLLAQPSWAQLARQPAECHIGDTAACAPGIFFTWTAQTLHSATCVESNPSHVRFLVFDAREAAKRDRARNGLMAFLLILVTLVQFLLLVSAIFGGAHSPDVPTGEFDARNKNAGPKLHRLPAPPNGPEFIDALLARLGHQQPSQRKSMAA